MPGGGLVEGYLPPGGPPPGQRHPSLESFYAVEQGRSPPGALPGGGRPPPVELSRYARWILQGHRHMFSRPCRRR